MARKGRTPPGSPLSRLSRLPLRSDRSRFSSGSIRKGSTLAGLQAVARRPPVRRPQEPLSLSQAKVRTISPFGRRLPFTCNARDLLVTTKGKATRKGDWI
jgi:hypothetical protein